MAIVVKQPFSTTSTANIGNTVAPKGFSLATRVLSNPVASTPTDSFQSTAFTAMTSGAPTSSLSALQKLVSPAPSQDKATSGFNPGNTKFTPSAKFGQILGS